MALTKQHYQILVIIEIVEFFEKYDYINDFIKKVNRCLPFGGKMARYDYNIENLSTLNNYSIKFLYMQLNALRDKFISNFKDQEE